MTSTLQGVVKFRKHSPWYLVQSLLLLSTPRGTPANSWFSCGSAYEWLATTTGTQGPCPPCYSWWPENCSLWVLSFLLPFPHWSDFQPTENPMALVIVLPFKFAPPYMARGSSWAESGIQFRNDKIPGDIGGLIYLLIYFWYEFATPIRSLPKDFQENFSSTFQTTLRMVFT